MKYSTLLLVGLLLATVLLSDAQNGGKTKKKVGHKNKKKQLAEKVDVEIVNVDIVDLEVDVVEVVEVDPVLKVKVDVESEPKPKPEVDLELDVKLELEPEPEVVEVLDVKVVEELQKAKACTAAKCKLPDCRCSDTTLPNPKFKGKELEIPQFVTITFDDAVNAVNFAQYDMLFNGLVNPDGCTATGTFFVSHEYTDYGRVNQLYNNGHEIALHSVTHGDGTDYWREADLATIEEEFSDQIKILETFAKVDPQRIRGVRLPFLQISGNKTYQALKHLNLTYDSSWPTQKFTNPPMWPYTLDYASVQDCQIGESPNAALPGVWVNPMVSWKDTEDYSCSMLDACVYPPADDVDALFDWMLNNFNRHYKSNRAPFGMYLHAAWFARGRYHFAAFKKFLNHLSTFPDVYFTSISRMLEYVRNPVLGKPFESCEDKPMTSCQVVSCNVRKLSVGEERYMAACDKCPAVYPWLKNPLGKRQ